MSKNYKKHRTNLPETIKTQSNSKYNKNKTAVYRNNSYANSVVHLRIIVIVYTNQKKYLKIFISASCQGNISIFSV